MTAGCRTCKHIVGTHYLSPLCMVAKRKAGVLWGAEDARPLVDPCPAYERLQVDYKPTKAQASLLAYLRDGEWMSGGDVLYDLTATEQPINALERAGLVQIDQPSRDEWSIRLTGAGVVLVEDMGGEA